MRGYKGFLAPLLFAFALGGCAVPQNTVLFATNTMIALDVSVNPTNGTPNVTIGYKRQEGVLMPLLASKSVYPGGGGLVGGGGSGDNSAADCTQIKDTDGQGKDYNPCVYRGVDGDKSDTYSVLATIGADINGTVATGTNASGTAKVAIAQFFATGLAARALADRGGAALVNTNGQAPDISPEAATISADIREETDQNVKVVTDSLRGDSNYPGDLNKLLDAAYPGDGPTATKLRAISAKDALIAYLKTDPIAAKELADATKSNNK